MKIHKRFSSESEHKNPDNNNTTKSVNTILKIMKQLPLLPQILPNNPVPL